MTENDYAQRDAGETIEAGEAMNAITIDLTTLKSELLLLMRDRWMAQHRRNKKRQTYTQCLLYKTAVSAIQEINGELAKANRAADAEPEPDVTA